MTQALLDPNAAKAAAKIHTLDKALEIAVRVKDEQAIRDVVVEKLEQEASFATIYKAKFPSVRDTGGPGRGNKTDDSTVAGLSASEWCLIYGFSQRTVQRNWLPLIDSERRERIAVDTVSRCMRLCRQEPIGTVRGTEGTGEFQLYTPSEYIEAARQVLGEIDLDPASSEEAQRTVCAKHFYTEGGLELPWAGRIFLNPPYHRELLSLFVLKLVSEFRAKRCTQAIMLTNNCTDTEWFRRAHEACRAICFTKERIKFARPGGETVSPTQGQAFFYFGNAEKKFASVFQHIGIGVSPLWGVSSDSQVP